VIALRVAAAAALLGSLLAACATRSTQPVMPNAPGTLRARATVPLIYLLDGRVPPTAIDEIPVTGGPPIAQIRNGLNAPGGGVVDESGTLYVVNFTGAQYQVLEYPSGTLSPALTVTIGIGFPGGGITVGPKSELYVLNLGGPLVKYDPGSATPSYVTYRGICPQSGGQAASGVTVDGFDTLYVLLECRSDTIVQEYDGGVPRVARTIHLASNAMPIGLTADKRGTLYVTYFDVNQRYRLGVAEYARRKTTPFAAFDFGPQPKMGSGGSGPVVDEVTGRLYTTFGICTQNTGRPWHCAGYIYGFRRGSKRPDVTITAPHLHLLGTPQFDSSGRLYTEVISPLSPLDAIWRYSASGEREARIVRNRALALITVWPNADSGNLVRSSALAVGFAPACQSTPMSQSSPRSFLAKERNAMSVSVLTIPSSAATCSVTKSLSCSCSFTRAMATRSNGPATE
jgi:hypothetical protein